ncbi:acyltransferase [Falsiroseomonas sp. HC035]|uniref:acyltransferase n=1 Tax=Falsiroseomonas sp. HC035 TaxID=3390999 RepID=UPI003D311036
MTAAASLGRTAQSRMPGALRHTLQHMLRTGALVSPRAEIEAGEPLGLGRKTNISAFTLISTARGPVAIGERTDVGTGCCILGHPGGIQIGDDCLISPNVVIGGALHAALETTSADSATTRIGNNVWIGSGAVVLPGAEIADGVIIAPNSVVSGSVGPNAIVQGNPGKVIFTRR